MKLKTSQIIFLVFIGIFFQACAFNKSSLKNIAQTSSASQIEEYKVEILESLIKYKNKLDLRNPSAFNINLKEEIINQIKTNQDYIYLTQDGKKLESYEDYFYYAFLDKNLNNRNDLLIIGLYKLIYKAYAMEREHQFVAFSYDKNEMQNLHKYLQIIRWKIKTAKNTKGEYLFNTWQNNWQIELEKKYKGDYNIINDLEYIKLEKESIYDYSNFSFEIVLSKIIVNVEYTLKKINVEPFEMGFGALRNFIFVL
ncbi:MAG: hypothetical protein U5K55_17290 [Aliarcobacter sp.]|nr:hypothetical protein [Aliarcobacter sp.]